MRKTFARLDDLLIERLFQPASDLISHRLGLGRTKIACCCIDFASLAWIVSRVGGLSDAVAAWDASTAFLDLALLLLGLVAMISLRTLFRKAGSKQGNPLRLSMQPHRGIALLMLLSRVMQLHSVDLSDVADLAMLVCAGSALYVVACMERPVVRRLWATPIGVSAH